MNLKKIRIYADLRQEDVAKILNVARISYAIWEQERDFIPFTHLNSFCNHFNISLDYALELSNIKTYKNSQNSINKKVIGKRLKIIRKVNGCTQEQLAAKLNISRGAISKYENGINLPVTSFMIGFCKYFNISCDYISGKIDEEIELQKKIKQ